MKKYLYFLCLLSTPCFSQVNLGSGLMAYYPFNGNANDASGNNNNPIFNNATPAMDRLGNPNSAYSFNGSTNYMRIPNSATLNTTNQMTICAWVKVSGFYPGTCHDNAVVMKGDDDYLPGNYQLRFSDNIYYNFNQCAMAVDPNHQLFAGGNSVTVVSNPPAYIQQNIWYSVVWTYDGSRSKTFVNCQLTQDSPSSMTFTNGYDLFFGRMNHPTYPYWFNGTMDEVRIYNRVLNYQEILAVGGCGNPDMTSSQFFTATQILPGAYIDEVIALRNTGNFNTLGPLSFTVTNYSALTGLTVTQIPPGTGVTIGIDTYTMSTGWSFNSGTGTFTSNNIILNGTNNLIGIRISRANAPNQGSNGIVTQTTSVAAGTGGETVPSQNNSISNSILKN